MRASSRISQTSVSTHKMTRMRTGNLVAHTAVVSKAKVGMRTKTNLGDAEDEVIVATETNAAVEAEEETVEDEGGEEAVELEEEVTITALLMMLVREAVTTPLHRVITPQLPMRIF